MLGPQPFDMTIHPLCSTCKKRHARKETSKMRCDGDVECEPPDLCPSCGLSKLALDALKAEVERLKAVLSKVTELTDKAEPACGFGRNEVVSAKRLRWALKGVRSERRVSVQV